MSCTISSRLVLFVCLILSPSLIIFLIGSLRTTCCLIFSLYDTFHMAALSCCKLRCHVDAALHLFNPSHNFLSYLLSFLLSTLVICFFFSIFLFLSFSYFLSFLLACFLTFFLAFLHFSSFLPTYLIARPSFLFSFLLLFLLPCLIFLSFLLLSYPLVSVGFLPSFLPIFLSIFFLSSFLLISLHFPFLLVLSY